jgi:hypothetical protein
MDDEIVVGEMCEFQTERHEWRAEALEFIRDRIEPAQIYPLGESDLAFGELLPPKPLCVEQAEHEERPELVT